MGSERRQCRFWLDLLRGRRFTRGMISVSVFGRNAPNVEPNRTSRNPRMIVVARSPPDSFQAGLDELPHGTFGGGRFYTRRKNGPGWRRTRTGSFDFLAAAVVKPGFVDRPNSVPFDRMIGVGFHGFGGFQDRPNGFVGVPTRTI